MLDVAAHDDGYDAGTINVGESFEGHRVAAGGDDAVCTEREREEYGTGTEVSGETLDAAWVEAMVALIEQ